MQAGWLVVERVIVNGAMVSLLSVENVLELVLMSS
jgi:hypothetical protein